MPSHFDPRRLLAALATLLPLAAAFPATAQTAPEHAPHPVAGYGKIPLHFEANEGQAAGSAKFLAHGPGYSLLLSPTGAALQLHHEAGRPGLKNMAKPQPVETIRMTLLGADPHAVMTAEEPSATYVNYMTGPFHKDWHLGVPTSLRTRTTAVYAGVDLVFYGNQRTLEYDFNVAPGADAAKIRMAVAGAKPVLAADGSLELRTGVKAAAEDLRFGKPVLYQMAGGMRRAVDGAFTVAGNGEIGFKIGSYDHTRALVIDPIISYASYFGGTGEDEINGSALNAAGQLYAVGQTLSAGLPGTAGEFETGSAANNNGHDAFVTKFSADGSSILWTTYLSGALDDFATSVAVNGNDQAYVVGYTSSCGSNGTSYATAGEFPFVGGVQLLCNPNDNGFNNYESNGGGFDAFLVKLSADGKTELYGTPLGGSANDFADSVVLDASGKVYLAGETESTQYKYSVNSNAYGYQDIPSYPVNNHGTAGIPGLANYPTTTNGFYLNTTESRLNSSTDSQGNVQGPQDEQAFLTVFSADLSTIVYSTLLGGPVLGNAGNGTSSTNGIAVAVNANGVVYLGGNTSSAHWPVTAGAFAPACANAGAANSTCNLTGWLAGFDITKSGAASLLFNTYVNGVTAGKSSAGGTIYPGSDVFGLTTDSTGNVIATGDTNAVDFPTTAGTVQPSCFKFNDGNGNVGVCESEIFLTKLTTTGATVWSTYLGASQQDIAAASGRGVVTDSSNNVYLLASSSSNLLPLKNPNSTTAGGFDYYIAELSPTASTVLMGTFLGIGGGFSPTNNSLSIDGNQTLYFGGSQAPNPYGGTYLPVTPNAFDRTIQGSDGFVVKLITQQQASAAALTVSPTGTATPTQTVTLTATLTTPSKLTGALLPTGTVTFLNGTAVVGTAKLNGSGVATYAGMLGSGTYSITANYAGDAGFAGAVSPATALTVSSAVATTTTETVTPASVAYGTPLSLSATVLAGSAPATSGTVTFTAGTLTLGSAMVNAQGVAAVSVTPAVGAYTVIASYAGTYNAGTNPNGFSASVSAGAAVTVTKAASTTGLATSAATVAPGVSFTLTATVPAAATGTVTFLNGTATLGTGTVANGVATLSTSIATAGAASLTAAYGGDGNYSGSTSAVVSVTVATPVTPASYSVQASPSTLLISRGSMGSSTLTFTPSGGFTGMLTLACGTLPQKATCNFAPATVALAGAPVTSTVSIGTGSLAALAMPELPGRRNDALLPVFALLFPGSLLMLVKARRRGALRRLLMLAVAVAGLGALGMLAGCSSNNFGANATPVGSYTVSVTITSGTATQTIPLNVTVQ